MFLSMKLKQAYTSPTWHKHPPLSSRQNNGCTSHHKPTLGWRQEFTKHSRHGTLLSRPHRQDNRSMQLLHQSLTLHSRQDQQLTHTSPRVTTYGHHPDQGALPSSHTHTYDQPSMVVTQQLLKSYHTHIHFQPFAQHHLESRY